MVGGGGGGGCCWWWRWWSWWSWWSWSWWCGNCTGTGTGAGASASTSTALALALLATSTSRHASTSSRRRRHRRGGSCRGGVVMTGVREVRSSTQTSRCTSEICCMSSAGRQAVETRRSENQSWRSHLWVAHAHVSIEVVTASRVQRRTHSTQPVTSN